MHPLVAWDEQFDWTHKFFHTDNWVAIAARHLTDELLLAADPMEFAVGGQKQKIVSASAGEGKEPRLAGPR